MPRQIYRHTRRPKKPTPLGRWALAGVEALEARAMLTAGTLDSSFAGAGLATSHPGEPAGLVMANSMAVESNGQIVQVGQAIDPVTHGTDIAVVRYNANGTLDTTFGSGGVALTPVTSGAGAPTASDVLIDPQGRILVVGGDGSNFELIRYTSTGQLDSTFGNGGFVSTPIPGSDSSGVASKVALDSAGDILVGGSAYSTQLGFFAPLFRYLPNGTLDTSFGLGGMAFANFPTVSVSSINSLLVEQDGSIVVGGNDSGNIDDWALLRFTSAGRPDPTFGTSGAVITSFGNSQETADSLAEQPDGKILAVGDASLTAAGEFDIARYNANGSLDTTFGAGGTLTTNFAGDHANALGVAIDPNGKIVVGGSLTVNGQSGTYFALARYLADGALDPTFGTAGLATTVGAAQNDKRAFDVSLALDPSGNIVLASSGANFNVARFTGDPSVPAVPSLFSADQSVQVLSSGAVPLVFSVQLSAASNQQVTVDYSTADGTAVAGTDYSAAVGVLTFAPSVTSQSITVLVNPNTSPEPDKSFVLNLSSPSGAPLVNDQYSGVILTNKPVPPAAGSLDFTFGWAGFAESHPGTATAADTANNVAVQSDGKVVEVGNVTDPTTGLPAFGIVRYNVDGSLDASFGTGGIVSTPILTGNSAATANAVLIQPNGDIVVVGGDGTNIVVARYLPSGTLDSTFGTQGIATIALPAADAGTGAGWDGERAALDSQGNILVAGSGDSPNLGAFGAVIRLNSSGTQDLSFGQSGLALLTFAGGTAITNVDALLVQANQQIVVSGGVGSLDPHWLVARLNANGAIDTQFGSSGVVSTSFGSGKNGETAYGLAQQSDGKLLVIGGASTSTSGGFDIARYNANGTLDTSFAGSGQLTTTFPNTNWSTGLNIAVLLSGEIVASGTAVNGNGPASIALAAYNSDGTLDTSFGNSGLEIPQIGGVSQTDLTMALAPSGQIVLASSGQVVPGGGAFDFNLARFNTGAPTISTANVTQPLATTPTTMVFALTLGQASATPVTVEFQTQNDTALAGQDYVAESGTVTFAPNSTAATISVAIDGDLYAEPDKSFYINLSGAIGAYVNPAQATGTIQNNNVPTWTNPLNALDVNGDGLVTPIDALDIIDYLNSKGEGTLPAAPTGVHDFLSTDGNGACTPLDVLKVINYLNSHLAAAVASPQLAAAADAVAGAGDVLAGAAGSAGGSASPTTVSAAGPATDIADVAFALASGAVRSPAVATNGTWPLGATTQTTAGAATSTTIGPAAQAAETGWASAGRRETDWSGKTDVEDLLDLLV